MFVAASSHAALYVILLIEALRGISLAAPDAATVTQLAAWAVATAVAGGVALLHDATTHVRHTAAV